MDDKNNGVWISREEYDRLQLEASNSSIVYPKDYRAPETEAPAPIEVTGMPAAPAKRPWYSLNPVYWLTPVALLSFIFPPLWLVLIIAGIMEIFRSLRSRHLKGSMGGTGKKRSPLVMTLIIVGCIIGGGILLMYVFPIVFVFFIAIIWGIGCSTGLGSCQSV